MKKIIYCIVTICFCQVAFSQTQVLKDNRDGKVYKTAKIGNQLWMAENLAFKCDSGCWVYNNDQSNMAKYGYLYHWEAAKIVCPLGWHLPSESEFETLLNNAGGDGIAAYNSLKQGGRSGFIALFSGIRSERGEFFDIEVGACFWSSTPLNSESAWHLIVNQYDSAAFMQNDSSSDGFSVRCIQDH